MRGRSLPLAPLLLALCVVLSSIWSSPGSAAPADRGPGLTATVHTAPGPGSSRLQAAPRQLATSGRAGSAQLSETARADGGGWWRQVGAALDPPQLTAKAAIAVDLTNQALLYADNPDEPLPPASTAKLVTALVAVRTLNLDEAVEIQPGDLVDPTVYANMGLAAGDRLSVKGLLTGLLVASAGDAANALARAAGQRLGAPSEAAAHQRFVAEMNRLARELGMRHSWFVAPDGRDMPGQAVTARDLAIATEALFQEPVLERIVSLPMATVLIEGPNPREVTLYSTNQWLGLPGVHGVKTGTTPAAGQCLIAAVWRGDARIITVVLGSQDRYADTQALLAWLDQHLAWIRVAPDGGFAPLDAALRERGLTLATSRTLLLTREDAAALEVRLDDSVAHSERAQWHQGTVVLLVRGQEVLRLPLYAADRFPPVS
jgi:D-alanyl-D-alanine carboxypeptidase (penicillin-binding protein 5/6)